MSHFPFLCLVESVLSRGKNEGDSGRGGGGGRNGGADSLAAEDDSVMSNVGDSLSAEMVEESHELSIGDGERFHVSLDAVSSLLSVLVISADPRNQNPILEALERYSTASGSPPLPPLFVCGEVLPALFRALAMTYLDAPISGKQPPADAVAENASRISTLLTTFVRSDKAGGEDNLPSSSTHFLFFLFSFSLSLSQR